MLLKLMWNRSRFGWVIGLGILKLIQLPTWEGVISLRKLWMLGGPCFSPGSSGKPLCFSFIGTWLLFPGSWLTMMRVVVPPLPHLVWDQGVAASNVGKISGLMLTLLCFPALLAS